MRKIQIRSANSGTNLLNYKTADRDEGSKGLMSQRAGKRSASNVSKKSKTRQIRNDKSQEARYTQKASKVQSPKIIRTRAQTSVDIVVETIE